MKISKSHYKIYTWVTTLSPVCSKKIFKRNVHSRRPVTEFWNIAARMGMLVTPQNRCIEECAERRNGHAYTGIIFQPVFLHASLVIVVRHFQDVLLIL